jgi:hypothetical protein
LQFLDKASGINLKEGSFRNISLIRNGKLVQTFDLYNFLLQGTQKLVQFQNGDTIFVGTKENFVSVEGDVLRPFVFEFKKHENISFSNILNLANPINSVTEAYIYSWNNNGEQTTKIIKLSEIQNYKNLKIKNGSLIKFSSEHYSDTIEIKISGEHKGNSTLIIPRNSKLEDIISQLKLTDFSDKKSIQLYRKSIAMQQKELILARLKELETVVLTYSAYTSEEASIRASESKSVLEFIERAKQVEPQGKITIFSEKERKRVTLEHNDEIYIPRKSEIVLIAGEVSYSNAITFVEHFSIIDYIERAGGLTDSANEDKILVIHKNGVVETYKNSIWSKAPIIRRGDSILVLPEIKSKSLPIAQAVTQILYQVIVSAGILINLKLI